MPDAETAVKLVSPIRVDPAQHRSRLKHCKVAIAALYIAVYTAHYVTFIYGQRPKQAGGCRLPMVRYSLLVFVFISSASDF